MESFSNKYCKQNENVVIAVSGYIDPGWMFDESPNLPTLEQLKTEQTYTLPGEIEAIYTDAK